MLSGSHVCRSADNLRRNAVAKVHGSDVQVVAVGMLNASEHLAYNQPLKPAFDCFYFLNAVRLKTDRSKGGRNLLRRKVEIKIFFQPVIRYIHNL